ncbi:hypothetical protein ENUP19_0261G0002 [Entamoeba nuttalli]|uniref:Uncharacterized protein n=1 Tax=Entamoeba nuttalli TaxID=412467 RepID=A0ABQ0D8F1_9EUKA
MCEYKQKPYNKQMYMYFIIKVLCEVIVIIMSLILIGIFDFLHVSSSDGANAVIKFLIILICIFCFLIGKLSESVAKQEVNQPPQRNQNAFYGILIEYIGKLIYDIGSLCRKYAFKYFIKLFIDCLLDIIFK